MQKEILKLEGVEKSFPISSGWFGRTKQYVQAVRSVSFDLPRRKTIGLVGESGCGKSTLGKTIMGLHPIDAGTMTFFPEAADTVSALTQTKPVQTSPAKSTKTMETATTARTPQAKFSPAPINLETLSGDDLRATRKHIQMIFQDPYGTLNPRMSVGALLEEGMKIHFNWSWRDRQEEAIRLLHVVGLKEDALGRYPHEFSGGQRQRLSIARALSVKPSLLICDECVSALDVSIQAQIIALLEKLRDQEGLSYIFISHDLAVVEHLSDEILVMYLGKIVEQGPAQKVIADPRHPYTQQLLKAVPTLPNIGKETSLKKRQRVLIKGEVPSAINPPSGCSFHKRCPYAEERCQTEEPLLRPSSTGRMAACHFTL